MGGLEPEGESVSVDTSVPHIARVYDYWLGGKDNFAADRIAGEETIAAYPAVRSSARANRAFLVRAVRYLAREAAVRQFLDIGAGLPAAPNTHEVAQSIAPDSRVIYVDNDPMVLSHGRALVVPRAVDDGDDGPRGDDRVHRAPARARPARVPPQEHPAPG